MQFTLIEFEGSRFVTAHIEFSPGSLKLGYDLGHIRGVNWPTFTGIHRADELWNDTCFEFFIGDPTCDAYVELNVSPSGGWNCYQFESYRDQMARSDAFSVESIDGRKAPKFGATIRTEILINESILIAPTVVLKEPDGTMRYFAIKHGIKPDFHERAHQVLVSPEVLGGT